MNDLDPSASAALPHPVTHGIPYRSATVAGRRLAYLDIGEGFPVLLGHSYLWDAAMWLPQLQALSAHFRVIAPDLWGHGRSEALPPGTRDIGDLAAHHLALLDALEIDECHAVGLSVGGMWAAELAQLAPRRVRKLVLMDTFLGGEPATSRAKYFGLLARIEHERALAPEVLDMVVPLFFSPWVDAGSPLYRGFRAALARFTAAQLVESIVPLGRIIFGRDDRLEGLRTLDAARTLVMVGECDIPRPVAEAAHMADIIGCRLENVAGAGHIANLENPRGVNDVLVDFLATLGARAGEPRHWPGKRPAEG